MIEKARRTVKKKTAKKPGRKAKTACAIVDAQKVTETPKRHRLGRPPKYETAAELQVLIEEYFQDCDDTGRPYTITGLGVALHMTREMIIKYQGKPEFKDTITRAKAIIHAFTEEKLFVPKIATGVAFSLKNNWNWKDKSEVDQNHSGDIGVTMNILNFSKSQDNA